MDLLRSWLSFQQKPYRYLPGHTGEEMAGESGILVRCLFCYARFLVGRWTKWIAILLPILATVFLGYGIRHLSLKADVMGLHMPNRAPRLSDPVTHVPHPSRSPPTVEEDDKKTNKPFVYETFFHIPIVAANANVNLLDEEVGNKVLDAVEFISTQLNYTYLGEVHSFSETACNCHNNNAELRNFFKHRSRLEFLRETLGAASRTELTYPIATILGNKFQIYRLFHDVSVNASTAIIERVGAISSSFNIRISSANVDSVLGHWEAAKEALIDYTNSFESDPQIRLNIFNFDLIADEINSARTIVIPYFAVAIIVVISAAIALGLNIHYTTASILSAVMGIASSLLATVSTVGVLSFIGISLDPSTVLALTVPFVLGLFLTFSSCLSWFRLDGVPVIANRLHQTSLQQKFPFIAAIATHLSFVVGLLISLFYHHIAAMVHSYCTICAIGTCFSILYHWTFFYASMAEVTRIFGSKRGGFQYNKQQKQIIHQLRGILESVRDTLTLYPFRIAAVTLYMYISLLALIGCTKLKLEFKMAHLFFNNSPLRAYFDTTESKILDSHVDIEFFVLKSPDFRNESNRYRFSDFLTELHNISFSFGRQSTQLWFQSYEEYLEYAYVAEEDYYKGLKPYLSLRISQNYNHDIRWDRNETKVNEFKFRTSFRDVDSWGKRLQLVEKLNKLGRKYREFNIRFYHYILGSFLNETEAAGESVTQILAITTLVLTMVGAILLRSLRSAGYIFSFFLHNSAWLLGASGFFGGSLDPLSAIPTLVPFIPLGLFSLSTVAFTLRTQGHEKKVTLNNQGWVGGPPIAKSGPYIHSPLLSAIRLGVSACAFACILQFIPIYGVQVFSQSLILSMLCGLSFMVLIRIAFR